MSSRAQSSSSKAGQTSFLSIPGKARLKRELSLLSTDPPPGIAAYLESQDNLGVWKSQVKGPEDSPFEHGIFVVRIIIPARYPFEPPQCRFVDGDPPYHPNIDASGRICLDTLKLPPAGSWSPAVSLPSLLTSLRSLLAEPNPDDGLEPEISNLYKHHPERWREEARRRTNQNNRDINTATEPNVGHKRLGSVDQDSGGQPTHPPKTNQKLENASSNISPN